MHKIWALQFLDLIFGTENKTKPTPKMINKIKYAGTREIVQWEEHAANLSLIPQHHIGLVAGALPGVIPEPRARSKPEHS